MGKHFSDSDTPASSEYTITQLAELTLASIRNIRAYQEKGILPAPVKRGRIAIYGEDHLIRLRMIQQLLNRGYSIANISEILHAHEQGHNLNQLIGLNTAVANIWTEEQPLYLALDALASRFSTAPTSQDIQYAFEVGVLEPAPDGLVKISHAGLLQLATTLIDYQFSFRQLLDIVVNLRKNLDTAAISVAEIGLSIVFPQVPSAPPLELNQATTLVDQLRPLFAATVAIELNNALSRALKQQMTQYMVSHVLKQSDNSS